MTIEIILEFAVLFLLKAIDNLLSTGKQILIQRHRPLLASLSVVVSQIIFYRLISGVSASGSDLALYIVSIASGVGTLIAVKLSDRFSKERTFVNVILSDDKEAMIELDELINIKIFWGGKSLFVKDFRASCHTVYAKTYDFLSFVAQPHDIVSVAIPHKTQRCNDVFLTFMP